MHTFTQRRRRRRRATTGRTLTGAGLAFGPGATAPRGRYARLGEREASQAGRGGRRRGARGLGRRPGAGAGVVAAHAARPDPARTTCSSRCSEDDETDVEARSEPILAIVIVAGMAGHPAHAGVGDAARRRVARLARPRSRSRSSAACSTGRPATSCSASSSGWAPAGSGSDAPRPGGAPARRRSAALPFALSLLRHAAAIVSRVRLRLVPHRRLGRRHRPGRRARRRGRSSRSGRSGCSRSACARPSACPGGASPAPSRSPRSSWPRSRVVPSVL